MFQRSVLLHLLSFTINIIWITGQPGDLKQKIDLEPALKMNKSILNVLTSDKIDELLKTATLINNNLRELIHRPRDCDEVKNMGYSEIGVYNIYPQTNEQPRAAFCIFEDDVGWTVILYRMKQEKQLSFNREWIHYRNGFGNPASEYWLGNEHMYQLLLHKDYMLKVDVDLEDGNELWGKWKGIHLDDEMFKYRLKTWYYDNDSTMPNVLKTESEYGDFFGIDKRNKDISLTCKEDEFMCENEEKCIPKQRKCDMIVDCVDISDEGLLCFDRTNCTMIPRKCDGVKDCGDGRDESDCEDRCDVNRNYQCSNGYCYKISRSECDLKCTDHSEISHCKAYLKAFDADGTGGYWFKKDNLINPTDEYDSDYFTVRDKEGKDRKISSLTYRIAPITF